MKKLDNGDEHDTHYVNYGLKAVRIRTIVESYISDVDTSSCTRYIF